MPPTPAPVVQSSISKTSIHTNIASAFRKQKQKLHLAIGFFKFRNRTYEVRQCRKNAMLLLRVVMRLSDELRIRDIRLRLSSWLRASRPSVLISAQVIASTPVNRDADTGRDFWLVECVAWNHFKFRQRRKVLVSWLHRNQAAKKVVLFNKNAILSNLLKKVRSTFKHWRRNVLSILLEFKALKWHDPDIDLILILTLTLTEL